MVSVSLSFYLCLSLSLCVSLHLCLFLSVSFFFCLVLSLASSFSSWSHCISPRLLFLFILLPLLLSLFGFSPFLSHFLSDTSPAQLLSLRHTVILRAFPPPFFFLSVFLSVTQSYLDEVNLIARVYDALCGSSS